MIVRESEWTGIYPASIASNIRNAKAQREKCLANGPLAAVQDVMVLGRHEDTNSRTLFVVNQYGFNAHAQEKIRVGLGSISLQSGLVHIGKDRGLFAKYGLTTESDLYSRRFDQCSGAGLRQSRSVAIERRARRGGQSRRRGYRLLRRLARQAELSADRPHGYQVASSN